MSTKHEGDKVISFDRGGLVFVFNFHATKSFTDYRIAAPASGKYRIVLDSDDKNFGGHGRLDHSTDYFSLEEPFGGRQHSMMVISYEYLWWFKFQSNTKPKYSSQVYAPCRACFVLARVD